MKTHKYILLLWLLVFAGSYAVLAQTDSISPGLPDEEVIRLRDELVEALENDSIEKARNINDFLWDQQPEDYEYLSFKERYLTLFLLGSFEGILETYPSVDSISDDTTRFQRIDSELRYQALTRHNEISTSIDNNYRDFDKKSLNSLYVLFAMLVLTKNENSIKSQNHEAHLYPDQTKLTEKNKKGIFMFREYNVPNKNKKYYIDNEVYNGFWLGTGIYFSRGWFNGGIKDYMNKTQAVSFFTAHMWYRRLYFETHLASAGVFNARDSISVVTNTSIGTHAVNAYNIKVLGGYFIHRSRWLDLTPYLGYLWSHNEINQIRYKNDALFVEQINHFGLIGGLNIDIRLINGLFNQVGIRLKGEFSFSRNNPNQNSYQGTAAHFGIGIIYSGNISY